MRPEHSRHQTLNRCSRNETLLCDSRFNIFVCLGSVLIFLVSTNGCLNDAKPSATLYDGSYQFTAVREDGSVEAEGTFVIDIDEQGAVSGTWTVEGMTGDGTLIGYREEDGSIGINFHPQYADHNFILRGSPSGQRFDGSWQWLGIMGVMKKGTFKALHE